MPVGISSPYSHYTLHFQFTRSYPLYTPSGPTGRERPNLASGNLFSLTHHSRRRQEPQAQGSEEMGSDGRREPRERLTEEPISTPVPLRDEGDEQRIGEAK